MDKLKKTVPGVILVGLAVIVVCCRLHTYEEPLERDITGYAVIAHEMLQGKSLYSDVWDHKPPAVHVTYAAAELAVGYGPRSIFFMTVAATVATMLACYAAGAANGGGTFGGVVAAALWAILSGDLAFEANQPNTEVFLNVFLTAGFAIFVRAAGNCLGTRRAALAGLLFAIASLYKQVVVAQVALLGLAYVVSCPRQSRKKALRDVMVIAGIGAAAWSAVFGYFLIAGHGKAFIDAVFTYNRWYSASMWNGDAEKPAAIVSSDVLGVLICLGTISIVGLVLGLVFRPARPWVLLLGFALGAEVAVLLPGWFFQHYYQLWLPILIVAVSWTITLLARLLPVRLRWLSRVTAGFFIVIMLCIEAPYYTVPAKMWSVRKYGGVFLATDSLARSINRVLLPNETFYEWGNETGLYFTSGRRPPSGVFFAYPMQGGPFSVALTQRVRMDLEQAKPELLVVQWEAMKKVGAALPLLEWCKQNYRWACDTKMFLILVRKGGRLDVDQPFARN
jgi:4-amino-4-deoxy-L-arabinose transferase-like glycosyltransferase